MVLLAIAAGAGFSMVLGTFAAYEWLLAAMLARPMVAFVMVLTDASTS